MSTGRTPGRLAAWVALLAPLHLATLAGGVPAAPSLFPALRGHPERMLAPLSAVAGAGLVLLVLGLVLARRALRTPPRTLGRGRLTVLGLSVATVSCLAIVLCAIAAHLVNRLVATGLPLTPFVRDLFLGAPHNLIRGAQALAVWLAIAGLAELVGVVTAWQLIDARVRAMIWWIADASLLVGVVVTTMTTPLEPATGELRDLLAPGARLLLTAIFLARAGLRALPRALDAVERFDVHALIASRHLRSRKSSFLTAISGLSILAVAFSSCMLTTVLSVMGGFRHDLMRKILGNYAHVAIDREAGRFEGWAPILAQVREVPGVVAATPYVAGEVMIASASSRAGVELRGIEPSSIGAVTDLARNVERGRLEYLERPERLLALPPEDRGDLFPLHLRIPDGEESSPDDEPAASAGSLTRDLDRLLEEELAEPVLPVPRGTGPEEALAEPVTPVPPAAGPREPDKPEEEGAKIDPEILPGILLGAELARTLRVFVGDDVDVVSPLGELGPSGPVPRSRPFRVAGVFHSGMYEYDMKRAFVLLGTAQQFLGTGDALTGIEARVQDIERAPEVASAIRTNLGRNDLRVRDWQDLNRNLFGALALEKLVMFITLGLAVMIAGFCVFGTLTLMVQEKGREVGILKAMGATEPSVVRTFLLEGTMIGALGTAAGLGLGFLVAYGAEHFGIRINPELYDIDRLPVHVDAGEFTLVGISSVLVCILATIFPAKLASRLRPVDALRYE